MSEKYVKKTTKTNSKRGGKIENVEPEQTISMKKLDNEVFVKERKKIKKVDKTQKKKGNVTEHKVVPTELEFETELDANDSAVVIIRKLVSKSNLQKIRNDLYYYDNWEPGTISAGGIAAKVKNNGQLGKGSNQFVSKMFVDLISNNKDFKEKVGLMCPYRIFSPHIHRYVAPDGEYGWHVDSPTAGGGTHRMDISYTVMVNDDYEGGELVLHTPIGMRYITGLKAGDAIFYPCDYIHKVAPVTKGYRLVANGWIHHSVRDFQKRSILYHIDEVRNTLIKQSYKYEKDYGIDDMFHKEILNCSYVANNLRRRWIDYA